MQKVLLVLVAVVFWTALYLFVPVLAPYAASLGAPLDVIGLVIGSYGVVQLCLRIPLGMLSDRLGRRKPFVAAGFAAAAVSCLVMARAPSAWHLVFGRGLSGLAATMWVMLLVLLAGTFPPERTAAAMGLASFANNAGQIIGTLGGGWIAQHRGMGAPFHAAAAVAAAGFLLLLPVADQRSALLGRISWQGLREVLADRPLWRASLQAGLLQYMAWVTVYGFTPVYAQTLGASRLELGLLLAANLLPGAVAALAAGRLARRSGVAAAAARGFLIVAAATAATPLSRTLPALFAVQVAGGAGWGLAFPLLMGEGIQAVPAAQRAVAMAVFMSAVAGGMFLGPLVAGALGQALGMTGLFLTTAALGLLPPLAHWCSTNGGNADGSGPGSSCQRPGQLGHSRGRGVV